MSNIFRTLIIQADTADLAREIAATLSPAGAGMWTTGLSSDGNAPATHYISTGYITEEFAYMVPQQIYLQDESGAWQLVETLPGNPEAVTQACNANGLEVTLEQVQAIFDTADVTEQEPFVAMQRLGLSLVQPEEPLK
jgi:hypothetical protein